MSGLHHFLTPFDRLVFGVVVLVVFLLPPLLRRSFRGGPRHAGDDRRLSWVAAGLALVANDLGGAALLAIPALTAAFSGNLTMMQWALGAWLARILLVCFWIGPLYREGGGDPFAFVGRRIGSRARRLVEWVGFAGTLLGQTVPFLAMVMLLTMLTPLPGPTVAAIAGGVVILWGMAGPAFGVGRDLLLFGVVAAAVTVLLVLLGRSLEGGWDAIGRGAGSIETFAGDRIDKRQWVDFRFDPLFPFTFWIAVLAVPFQQLQSLGAGALARRTLARCHGVRKARLAVIFSAIAPAFVWLLLGLGTAVFGFYAEHRPEDSSILRALEWNGGGPGAPGRALPVWILTETAEGWKGALLAAIALSTLLGLDNCFQAGSLALGAGGTGDTTTVVRKGSFPVVFIVGSFLAVAASALSSRPDATVTMFEQAVGAGAWCGGSALGILLVAMLGRARPAGLILALPLAWALVLGTTPQAWNPLSGMTPGWQLSSAWMWPVTALLTVLFGWDFRTPGLQNSK
jgi:SSS family solute:Na+ symporter